MKTLMLAGSALVISACATVPTRASDGVAAADRAAVISAVQSLFSAMRTRDTTAIRAAFLPNTHLVSIRPVTGASPRVQIQPLAAFITSIGRAGEELAERMWDPRVEVAGDLASLWAPYDFRIGTRFSHCGHDALHLVRTAEGWKIAAITYTVVTAGCTSP